MKKILLLLVLFLTTTAFSQNVNDYEYVIVPAKFSFLKVDDKYRLNTNSRLLLQKYGFKSVFPSDSIPSEIANNNCKKLYFDLVEDNKFLITKIKIVLKDCREKLLFESDYGTSKEKELEIAYNKALREAGKSFDKLNYKYNGKNNSSITQASSKTIVSGVSLSRIAADGSSDIAWETDKVKSAAKIKVINVQPPARFL